MALMATGLGLGLSVCCYVYKRRLRTTRVLGWSQRSIVDHNGAIVATGVV